MTAEGYACTRDHLNDEFRRLDSLIRAQVVRWRVTLADTKPPELWGMVHVTEQEVGAFMRAPFRYPDELPEELARVLAPFWAQAAAEAEQIAHRLGQTRPDGSRLSRLVTRFALSRLERDVLLLALLPALDERYRRLFGYLQDDCSRSTPAIELIAQILRRTAPGVAVRAALSPTAPLIRRRLVHVEASEGKPLALRGVRIDDRVAGFLCEADDTEDELVEFLEVTPNRAAPGSSSWAWPSLDHLLQWAAGYGRGDDQPIILLHGSPGGRVEFARSLCRAAGAAALVVDVPAALRSPLHWSAVVDRIYREVALRGGWAVWRNCDGLSETGDLACLLATASESIEGTALISAEPLRVSAILGGRAVVRLEAPVNGAAERERIWLAKLAPAMGGDTGRLQDLASQLAGAYRLSPSQIDGALVTAAAGARGRDPRWPRLTADDLARGCRAQSALGISGMAKRLEPRDDLSLADVIVPPATATQISDLQRRITCNERVTAALGSAGRRATRGLTAMFTGPSGCGKTLAAEALASEQRVDLYRVDLSAVVSKYVGETEKNLARIFAEIHDSNGILFFDEADALFGKRGEVVEARDRWANTEVNYLLQALEQYDGVVILATNLRQNIDSAFMRRIRVVIEFPFPDAASRLAMWRSLLDTVSGPPEADLELLAERFQLAGGSIANIVEEAAFRAAVEAGTDAPKVRLGHLAAAIASEYHKLGKPVTRGEFGADLYGMATAREPLLGVR